MVPGGRCRIVCMEDVEFQNAEWQISSVSRATKVFASEGCAAEEIQ